MSDANKLSSFFSDKGNLPETLTAENLKPTIPQPTPITNQEESPEPKETTSNQTENPKAKDFGDILNDLSDLSDKENVSADDIAGALGADINEPSKEDLKLANDLGIGAEEIIELIDAGRKILYLNLYDKKIDLEDLEDELNELIQKSNRSTEENERMKQLNGFIAPARKARQKFVDGIPYRGGLRKRMERVAKMGLAKLVQGGKVPEWAILVILMGFQEGKLVLNLYADNKSLPKI